MPPATLKASSMLHPAAMAPSQSTLAQAGYGANTAWASATRGAGSTGTPSSQASRVALLREVGAGRRAKVAALKRRRRRPLPGTCQGAGGSVRACNDARGRARAAAASAHARLRPEPMLATADRHPHDGEDDFVADGAAELRKHELRDLGVALLP